MIAVVAVTRSLRSRAAVTRSLRSLRSGELIVLRVPAEPAPSALSSLAGSRLGPPLAASAAAGAGAGDGAGGGRL